MNKAADKVMNAMYSLKYALSVFGILLVASFLIGDDGESKKGE